MGVSTSQGGWLAAVRRWMSEPAGPGGLRDGAVVLAVVRTLVFAFLFPFVAWLEHPHRSWVFVVVAGATVGHAVFIAVYVRGKRPVSLGVAQATILVDTVAIGIGVLLTGGATSAAVVIWAPNLAIGAVWIGVRSMIPAIALVVAEVTALGISGYSIDENAFTTGQTAVLTAFMLTMLVVVGGVVAQRQRRTMLALDAAEARARKDQLTGLLNRTAIEERMAEELARAARYQLAVSVLMVDLDDFKLLNDSRGHLVGDLALVGVGGVLLGDKRVSDSAARLGGEEFLVLLPETGEEEAVAIAERLRVKIGGTAASGVHLSASIGVACYPDHAGTNVELLMAADSALYAAKAAGKNRVAVHDQSTSRPIRMVPGDPGFAAALARRATEIATDRGMDDEIVQAVRMAALAEVFEGHPIADAEITAIIATARDQLVREHAELDGPGRPDQIG